MCMHPILVGEPLQLRSFSMHQPYTENRTSPAVLFITYLQVKFSRGIALHYFLGIFIEFDLDKVRNISLLKQNDLN